jgi:hypothetical protein
MENILIDEEDKYLLSRYKWRFVNGYLATNQFHGGLVYLQRFLMKAGKGERVEFLNGNRLDYRKSNLRINNRIKWKNKPEDEKGIVKIKGKFYKYRWINGKNVYLGKIV